MFGFLDRHFYVGLDIGQRRDPTALAVVEAWEEAVGFPAHAKFFRYGLRHLERERLGTPYPDIVSRVREVVGSPKLGRSTLVMDGTGVGAPVVDLVRAADLRCELVPVVITGGDRAYHEHGTWRVPKVELITGLQLMVEKGELKIADMREGPRLVEELMNLRMQVGERGRSKYGSRTERVHDDMALAVALACWRAKLEERSCGERGERLL